MKVCVAYDSKYGNGKKCVEYFEKVVRTKGHNISVFSIHDVKPETLPQSDLYIFSAPTHIGGPPRKMKKFLKNLNIKTEGAKYSLITTFMDPSTKTLVKMSEILDKHNITKASEGVKIKVDGMKGPLGSGFQKQIDDFAINLLK